MTEEELKIIIEEYKIYTESKDKFVDRSFATNKFYFLLILALIPVMFLTKEYSFAYGLSSTLILSLIGMAICALWWINVDCYNFLIKAKLSKVLEKIEEQLPVQPNKMEFEAINSTKINEREFVFADIQKCVATLTFVLFLILFSYEILWHIFS